jgi:hypothetical protein
VKITIRRGRFNKECKRTQGDPSLYPSVHIQNISALTSVSSRNIAARLYLKACSSANLGKIGFQKAKKIFMSGFWKNIVKLKKSEPRILP